MNDIGDGGVAKVRRIARLGLAWPGVAWPAARERRGRRCVIPSLR